MIDGVGYGERRYQSISQSSVSIFTSIPSATDVKGSHPWSDSLGGGCSSGVRVSVVNLSSGPMVGGSSPSAWGSHDSSVVTGGETGSGPGCVLHGGRHSRDTG